ncbi:MAG TPA: MoaD/ThiS family protein [Bdellovibrionota bacterium]|nr:MoaD/ThiS family protein [Bdellovibrionota bacterium]
MAIKVLIPTPLRVYTQDRDSVEVGGKNIDEVLLGLAERYPELTKHLMNDKGELRRFVNVYLDDEDVRYNRSKDARREEALDSHPGL